MEKKSVIALSAVIIVLAASVSFSLISIDYEGTWPDTWPTELEQFRKQSKSYHLSSGTEEEWHEILFHTREEFERAWPHIVKLKTKGAPLIIESTQTAHGVFHRTTPIGKPGVRIRCPSRSEWRWDGGSWPTPLPDSITLPSGGLPEYVVCEDGKWTAAIYQDGKWVSDRKMFRTRIDIVLIIDGEIVDLNRIPLPADTPVIDRRFNNPTEHQGAVDAESLAFPDDLMAAALDPSFQSTISHGPNGDIKGKRVKYSKALSGFLEVGDTRLVYPGLTFTGRSSGSVVISSKSSGWSMGRTGTGDRRFTHSYENGVDTCTFGGVTFTLSNGFLHLGNRKVCLVDENKEAMFVEASGKVTIVDIDD
ncbi:MAG: hypothetical protein IH892_08595 [Planctomycetes bacterium]|nr:hypothetical protein [Planctomycetota bacterium]